jgi:hypothetical protein
MENLCAIASFGHLAAFKFVSNLVFVENYLVRIFVFIWLEDIFGARRSHLTRMDKNGH